MSTQPAPLFTCHRKVGAGVPLAATVKFALCPAVTVRLTGCAVITGAAIADGKIAVTT
jgi:hypothetical protein